MRSVRVAFALLSMFSAACAGNTETVEVTVLVPTVITRVATEIAEIEVTRVVEKSVDVTRLVEVEVARVVVSVVTATFSPTPILSLTPTSTPTVTPTPSNTPTPTNTPTQTPTPNVAQTATAQAFAQLTRSRGSGFYLVDVDIAPGLWRSNGSNDDCYWARYNRNNDVIDNHFGRAGGAMRIFPSDFQVEFDDCGTWEYLGP